jgi:hypothetical protein
VDTFLADGVEPDAVQRWVQSASILHSDGDAMDIAVADGRTLFKTATAALTLVARGDGRPSPAPTTTASAPVAAGAAPPTSGGPAARTTEQELTPFSHGHKGGAR